MDALVYRENHVPLKQKLYQTDPRLTYQRGPRSRLYMGIYMGIFTLGMLGSVGGIYNMAVGKKQTQEE